MLVEKYKEKYKGRDLLSLHDYSSQEILEILEVAEELKAKQKQGIAHPLLQGKSLGMVFEKSSTRTRISFEVAMYQLGGQPIFLSGRDLQMGRGEPISDTARVLSRYLDGIMIRTFSHDGIKELAHYADIPIINGLTDLLHPCQVLADLLTIKEHKGTLKGLKLAYVGDGNNMAHSLILGGAKVGMDVFIASPKGYEPNPEIVKKGQKDGEETGATIKVVNDPVEAVKDADVIYTDVWASMGQEEEQKKREKVFASLQINSELVKHAKSDYLFLHCLPAHRGEEVTEEVLEGPNSVVFDEAENRLHAQKAVLALLL